MARVTHVKKAQQRYETKPVLDENGQPVKIALTQKDGSPKMTSAKRGRTPRPITITKTERDLTKPLPPLWCDFPRCTITDQEIRPGQAYKWIKPKSGPYGGHQRNRHAEHPSWQVWEYSHSLSANVARIEHDATSAVDLAEDESGVEDALNEAAEAIRELAEQKREGASNIEDGFGHATYQSEELERQADDLDGWADEVEGTDVEALDQFNCSNGCTDGQATCDTCNGEGNVEGDPCDECDECGEKGCDWCDGTGYDLEDARNCWAMAVADALGNCPV